MAKITKDGVTFEVPDFALTVAERNGYSQGAVKKQTEVVEEKPSEEKPKSKKK